MITSSSILLPIIIGFLVGIGFFYLMLKMSVIKIDRIDEKTLLFKLPLLGTTEAEEQKKYNGIFVKNVFEDLDKIKIFQRFIKFDLLLYYAKEYNINYIGFEGDMNLGWSAGKLAYSTMSKGHNGGHNIYLNPDLDRKAVSSRLSKDLGLEIQPDELYTFLFLHEIGHTKKAGNECYLTAMVNHSLSGGRRAVRRRRELKEIYLRAEKFADDFAIKELLKIRQKGLN